MENHPSNLINRKNSLASSALFGVLLGAGMLLQFAIATSSQNYMPVEHGGIVYIGLAFLYAIPLFPFTILALKAAQVYVFNKNLSISSLKSLEYFCEATNKSSIVVIGSTALIQLIAIYFK